MTNVTHDDLHSRTYLLNLYTLLYCTKILSTCSPFTSLRDQGQAAEVKSKRLFMSSFCSSTRYWTALEICIWQTYVVGPSMGPGSIKPVNDQVSKYSENCNSFRTSPHHVLW